MKKYIEIIRKQTGNNQNRQYKIEKVARGYAFNYLIPNQLAEFTTKGKLKHINMLNSLSDKKKIQLNKQSQRVNNEIKNIRIIHIRKKCGNNHQFFGSISEQDIQNKISKLIGGKIQKKQIIIKPIKQLGTFTCNIIINEEIKTNIKLKILPYSL